ncbi:HAD-IIB family hydrolase [Escherichia coli]
MNRHRPEGDALFKEAVFKYALYEPDYWSRKASAKCSSPAIPMNNCCRWSRRLTLVGAIASTSSFSTLTCLEVMAGSVSKGHALEAVAKKLGYSLKDCIAFGDGMNDAEMLSMAGKGWIMGSAHQRLKDPSSRAGSDWY